MDTLFQTALDNIDKAYTGLINEKHQLVNEVSRLERALDNARDEPRNLQPAPNPDPEPTKEQVKRDSLKQQIEHLLNSYSAENESNTPDFILATYITRCLDAFNEATNDRTSWYGNSGEVFRAEKLKEANHD